MITMHARPRQTDGQTDKHHGNSATIRSTNALRVDNSASMKGSTLNSKFQVSKTPKISQKLSVAVLFAATTSGRRREKNQNNICGPFRTGGFQNQQNSHSVRVCTGWANKNYIMPFACDISAWRSVYRPTGAISVQT